MTSESAAPTPREDALPGNRPGSQIRSRPEFRSKPAPLTFKRDALVSEAVAAMAERNYGSVVIVDEDNTVEGVLTERDVLRRVVSEKRDPETTPVEAVMTENPRTARETDDLVAWLRMMSNERFRRLPVVDEDGRLIQVLTQGDFVSYTWPDLMYQAAQLGKATVMRNFQPALIVGAVIVYPLIVLAVFGVLAG